LCVTEKNNFYFLFFHHGEVDAEKMAATTTAKNPP
jgi:hypothetical protein